MNWKVGRLWFVLTLTVFCIAGLLYAEDEYDTKYDMRIGLSPERLTIAMWDFSWLYGHYEGGHYEDWSKNFDELKERGFNTVRIDCYPLVVGTNKTPDDILHLPANPLANWGYSEKAADHKVTKELIEFMQIAKDKGVYVILSSWGQGKQKIETKKQLWDAWDKTLSILKENNLLDHVLYVDFDQEFPFFSPFQEKLNELGKAPEQDGDDLAAAMEAAGQRQPGFAWNNRQLDFVRNYINSTLRHFHDKYPELRFTFSFTTYWKEARSLDLQNMDVLELHFWIRGPKFDERVSFGSIKKDRGDHDFKEYMQEIQATMDSVRPMLMKDMANRMAYATAWSQEISAPLVTTEAWGAWWHMDHEDLEWSWLYKWCEDCMAMSENYKFWGITPWNFSHPYWDNWSNVSWYQRVNNRFLRSK